MGTTLITGADGYMGRCITSALIESSDDDLILAVRAQDQAELDAKIATLEQSVGAGSSPRIAVVAADLREPEALAQVDSSRVTRILHAAAVTRFNVDRDLAQQVNVDGTVRVRDFAARCANIEQFVSLSTLYTAGQRQGVVPEEHLPDVGFVNHYEWSKWAAEGKLLEPDAPPVVIARLPTVISDNDDGDVTQHNAFHNTMKLYYYGLLSLLPGNPSTTLSLATADFAVSAVGKLLDPVVAPGIYHVCPDVADTLTLGEAVDKAFEMFSTDDSFRRRRLLPPVVCDRESFEDVKSAAQTLRGGPLAEALGSITTFAEQLYLPKQFSNDALHAVWSDYRAPDPAALVESVCRSLVASRWGRN